MKDKQPPDPLSFAIAQALFCQTLQARNASPRTVTAYSDDVIQFVAWLKTEIDLDRVGEVQREDIEAFLAHLGANGSTGTSRRRKLCALRGFFTCLTDHGHISHNPRHSVANPKAEEHTPQILYRHEYKALLYEARENRRDLAILQVFLQTGVRVGGLCALTQDDIDLKGKGPKDPVIRSPQEVSLTPNQYLTGCQNET